MTLTSVNHKKLNQIQVITGRIDISTTCWESEHYVRSLIQYSYITFTRMVTVLLFALYWLSPATVTLIFNL